MVALSAMYPSADTVVSETVIGTLKTMLKSSPGVTGHQFEYTVVNKTEVRLFSVDLSFGPAY